jgi:hypothetical protein
MKNGTFSIQTHYIKNKYHSQIYYPIAAKRFSISITYTGTSLQKAANGIIAPNDCFLIAPVRIS